MVTGRPLSFSLHFGRPAAAFDVLVKMLMQQKFRISVHVVPVGIGDLLQEGRAMSRDSSRCMSLRLNIKF